MPKFEVVLMAKNGGRWSWFWACDTFAEAETKSLELMDQEDYVDTEIILITKDY